MPRLTEDQLRERSQAAWSRKKLWTPLLREAYEFAQPQTNPYHNSGDGIETPKNSAGQSKTTRVFDSTLVNATTRLANRLQSELCPPFQKWAKLTAGPFIEEQQKAKAEQDLGWIEERIFAALQISNFDTAANEFFLDLVTAGTACMQVRRGNDLAAPVNYRTIPQSQVALADGPFGDVWEIHRKFKLRLAMIVPTWKKAKISDALKRRINEKPDEEILINECTYYDAADDVWYYDVQTEAEQRDGRERIIEETFEESIWIVTRWLKAVGEVQGRSPVMMALPDAKTLNKLKELILKNGSLTVHGVFTAVGKGNFNPNMVRVSPGAVISVDSNGGPSGPSLQRLPVGGDLQMGQIIVEDLRMAINQAMFNKALPDQAGPVRSVTEILERIKELQQDLGAPFGRVTMEFLVPVLQKTLFNLSEEGVIPKQNGQALKLKSGMVDVVFQSPLAQTQSMADVESAMQWMQLMQSLGEQAFMLNVNVENAGEFFADRMGVDKAIVRDKDSRVQMQQAAGAIAGQQMAAGGEPPSQMMPPTA